MAPMDRESTWNLGLDGCVSEWDYSNTAVLEIRVIISAVKSSNTQ